MTGLCLATSTMTQFLADILYLWPAGCTPDFSKECGAEEAVLEKGLHMSLTDPQSQRPGCNGMMNGAAVQSSGAHILVLGVKRVSPQLWLQKRKLSGAYGTYRRISEGCRGTHINCRINTLKTNTVGAKLYVYNCILQGCFFPKIYHH